MNDLPESWEVSTVGEIATVQLGRQRSPKNHTGPHMRPYLRSANVTWRGIDTTDVKEMNFDPDEAATFELREGDILLNEASGSPGEVGKPAIWRNEIPGTCFQNTLLRVRSAQLDEGYLYWYFYNAAFTGRFGEAGRGVNIRHLGKQGLVTFPIPVPPLSEQRRIVAAIEEHFSRLDAADRIASGVVRRLDVLATAASAVLLDSGADWVPLADITEQITDGDHRPPPRVPDGVPHLTARHVKDGKLDFTNCTYVSEEGFRQTRSRYEPKADDIIVTCVGTVGEVAVVPPGLRFSADRNLAAVRVGESPAGVRYLAAVLSSPTYRNRLQKVSGSTAQPHLYLKDLRAIEVPLPNKHEQDRLVEELSAIEEARRRVLRSVQDAQARTTQLRRSVLAAAFSGQLVPQDPSDESASAMLEHIAAERAAAKPSRKKKKKIAS
jgi:type I restriction enzyme S subunit